MSTRGSRTKRRLKARLFGGHAERPCCFCRRVLTFDLATLEHVVPLSHGGGWELENLRLSCSGCNGDRGTQDFEAYRARVRKRKGKA